MWVHAICDHTKPPAVSVLLVLVVLELLVVIGIPGRRRDYWSRSGMKHVEFNNVFLERTPLFFVGCFFHHVVSVARTLLWRFLSGSHAL